MAHSSLKEFLSGKVITKNYLCNIVHLNAQSLCDTSHFEEFCFSFLGSGVNIIAVSETFLKPGIKAELPGYEVIRNDRSGKGGGGVAVYVMNGLVPKLLSASLPDYSNKPEYVILEIKLHSEKLLFACVYRPPKAGSFEQFIDDLCVFIPNYKYLVICGDINARFGSGSFETDTIETLLKSCNVTCLPFGNTFHTASCDSALDIIATNCNSLIVDFDKTSAAGFSAHDLLYACINISTAKTKPKYICYRDINKVDEVKLKADAEEIDWSGLFLCNSIDGKVDIFNNTLISLFDKHAPLKRVKIKYKPNPWITDDIIILSRQRDAAYLQSAKSKLPADRAKFKALRNRCKQEIRNAKLRYCHTLSDFKISSREMWSAIRKLGCGKNKNPSVCSIPPDTLNEHYLSVASVTDPDLIDTTINEYLLMDDKVHEKFYFKSVIPEDVINAILSITSKAEGVDGISIVMLKMCLIRGLIILVPVLSYI
jgi:hypothetical protein